jgi:hypothetical protein
MVGSAFGWNSSPDRIEFYSLNIDTIGVIGQDKFDKLRIRYAKKWFLDGSYANSANISDIAVTITSVTRSYTFAQGNT